jgi:hypothetical protein
MTDLQKFPNAMIPAWLSGDTGTVAPSGATFLTGRSGSRGTERWPWRS